MLFSTLISSIHVSDKTDTVNIAIVPVIAIPNLRRICVLPFETQSEVFCSVCDVSVCLMTSLPFSCERIKNKMRKLFVCLFFFRVIF